MWGGRHYAANVNAPSQSRGAAAPAVGKLGRVPISSDGGGFDGVPGQGEGGRAAGVCEGEGGGRAGAEEARGEAVGVQRAPGAEGPGAAGRRRGRGTGAG